MRSVVVLLFLVAAGAASAQPAEGLRRAPVVEALVREAFSSNLALQSEQVSVAQALAQLDQARSQYQPRLDLVARYTLAEGGRSIDLPIGDLLNPVYSTLNDLLAQPGAFPSVSNQSIPFLRSREQETKLRLVQPLYRPEIRHGVRARRAAWQSRTAELQAYRRELRLEVESAWYRLQQAESAVAILGSALELTAEAVRANRLLLENDKITEDRLLRAQADELEVQQQLSEARRDRNSAQSYLNFLLNRPLTSEVPRDASDGSESLAAAERLAALPSRGPEAREELLALREAVKAAAAAEEAQRSRLRPTLGLAVEGGIQGEDYQTGSGANFVMGSLVAEANLWDGRERRSALQHARLERRRMELQLESTQHQLSLQIQRARDDLQAALAGLTAARLRREATAKAFHLTQEREREGMASQLALLDARNAFTRAELNLAITRNRVLLAAAALDRAAALSPLP